MKKSQIVGIGLLALSIASCRSHHKEKQRDRDRVDQYQSNPNYYIDNGAGYQHGGVSPFWIYWMMSRNSYGGYYYVPTYVHQSYGRNGTYHATSMGTSRSISRSSISRSGFTSSRSRSSFSNSSRSSVSRSGFGHSSSSHGSSASS